MVNAVEMGVKAAQAKRPGEAARWFRAALAERPGDVRVQSWLGQALCADGALLDGVAALRDAGLMLSRAPTAAGRAPAIAIAAELQRLTAIDESLAVLDALSRVDAVNAQAVFLLATALAQINRPADALEAGRQAARLSPGNPAATLLLASLEHDVRDDEAAEQRVRALMTANLPPREAYRARKLLAAILDRRGAYGDAFAELGRAETLAPKVPELAALDRNVIANTLADAAAGYTPDLLCRFKDHAFDGRAAPVFIVGFFRSGTTMMQQILGSHPHAFVADEAPLIDAAIRALSAIDPAPRPVPVKLAALDAAGIQRLRDAYWVAVEKRLGKDALAAPVFVDKMTMNTINLGFINTVFPDATCLFMVRDPRDACLSAYLQQMPPSPATLPLSSWTGTAQFYAKVMRWWLDVRPSLCLKWREVRYENLIEDFEAELRPALALANLSWDDALTRFHERGAGRYISTPSRSQVSQPLYRTSLERWRNYAPQIEPVAPILAPFVEAFGYPAASA
jgi:cytochrome c-type biogenesis protein CcmH/NrfG